MKIKIDKKSGIPLYFQIKHQIKKLLETESLKEGEQLPVYPPKEIYQKA